MSSSNAPPAPIHDDRKLAPTEDLEREPDGIPHVVIGAGVLVLLVLAAMLLILLSGHAPTNRGAVMALAIGIPVLVGLIAFVATRWRKQGHAHASR